MAKRNPVPTGAARARVPHMQLAPRTATATVVQTVAGTSTDPVAVFVARYGSAASRRSMTVSLATMARILTDKPEATAHSVPWHQLRYQHTQALRAKLVEGYAPSSANRHLSALRGILTECWRLGLMTEADLRRAVDLPAARGSRVPAGRALSADELARLFAAAERDHRDLGRRDAAMLCLAYGGGLRRSEIAGAALDAYEPATGQLTVLGKGNKQRIVYLPDNARHYMNAWLLVRGRSSGPLLTTCDATGRADPRRHITPDGVAFAIADLAARANVQRFSPHDLRRTYITALLDADVDVITVRNLAGHASVNTTSRYDRRDEKSKKTAVQRLKVPMAGTEKA